MLQRELSEIESATDVEAETLERLTLDAALASLERARPRPPRTALRDRPPPARDRRAHRHVAECDYRRSPPSSRSASRDPRGAERVWRDRVGHRLWEGRSRPSIACKDLRCGRLFQYQVNSGRRRSQMGLFRRQTDELEARLRERSTSRATSSSTRSSAASRWKRTRHKLRPVLGIAVAAVGLAMFGAFGGLSYASSAGRSVVHVISPSGTVTSGSPRSGGVNSVQHATASTEQYGGSTTICHKIGNDRYKLMSFKTTDLPGHKGHGDTLPGPGGRCPGPPIP